VTGGAVHAYRPIVVAVLVVGCQRSPGDHAGSPQNNAPLAASNSSSATAIDARVGNPPANVVDATQPKDSSPVTAAADISPATIGPGDTATLSIRIRIAPGWHIYALDGGSGPNQPTQIELMLPRGISAIAEWKAPVPGAQVSPTGLVSVYSGEAVFSRLLRASEEFEPATDSINCEFRFQACDHSRCLRPQSILLTVPIHVIADKE
jgi:DsbC/DsbD-like thiol-disulfide interchange protein